jgi:DNA-binding CsgD family transcriptional regulator/tetratricopeptide (TPR) repeat protein
VADKQLRMLEGLLIDGAGTPADRLHLPFAVLAVLGSAAADQPLLMVIDDWDALDEPSREILSFVARRTESRPMGVLVSSRPHRSCTASLAGLPDISLSPLSPAVSAQLLAMERPGLDAQTVRDVLVIAAGNPLALLELPTDSAHVPPYLPPSSDRLSAALAPGAPRLPSDTRDLLLVAALHPTGDLPLLLSAASRIDGTAIDFAAVEPAERAGLVTLDGARLLFSHPATAGAAVHGVDATRCRAGHAALATVLPHGSVSQLWHLSQAAEAPDAELACHLESGYLPALDQRDPLMAVRLLQRAADLYPAPGDRARCALRAAQVAHDLGLEHMARRTAHRALRHPLGPLARLHAETLTQPRGAGEVLQADPLTWPTALDASEEESALELAELVAPKVTGDHSRVAALLAVLDALPTRASDPRLLKAMATVAPVRRASHVARRLAGLQGLSSLPAQAIERLGEAAMLIGDPLRALDMHRQAEQRYRFQDMPERLPRVLLQQELTYMALGDWRQAERSLGQCLELALELGQCHHAAAARLLTQLVRSLRTGTLPPGGSHSRDLEVARRSVPSIDEMLLIWTAVAQLEGGNAAACFTALSSALADPDLGPTVLFAVVPYAEAAATVHATAQAEALLSRLETRFAVACPSLASVQFSVARAILAEDSVAEDLFDRALAMDLRRRPSLEGMLRLAHGRWLRRRHQHADSRVSLRRAGAAFTMVGADARASQIAAELRASGERAEGSTVATARPLPAVGLLSAQELQIARLAGQGLSNREIGALLQLSPRTIGSHLYRIFPRLGVTARAQLAQALGDGNRSG